MMDTFPLLLTKEANSFMFFHKTGDIKSQFMNVSSQRNIWEVNWKLFPESIATEYQSVNLLSLSLTKINLQWLSTKMFPWYALCFTPIVLRILKKQHSNSLMEFSHFTVSLFILILRDLTLLFRLPILHSISSYIECSSNSQHLEHI